MEIQGPDIHNHHDSRKRVSGILLAAGSCVRTAVPVLLPVAGPAFPFPVFPRRRVMDNSQRNGA